MSTPDTDIPLAPGDEAPSGTPGTGDEICPICGGSGKEDSAICRNCNGTGTITQGIGGG